MTYYIDGILCSNWKLKGILMKNIFDMERCSYHVTERASQVAEQYTQSDLLYRTG